jgi:hypothetical protein
MGMELLHFGDRLKSVNILKSIYQKEHTPIRGCAQRCILVLHDGCCVSGTSLFYCCQVPVEAQLVVGLFGYKDPRMSTRQYIRTKQGRTHLIQKVHYYETHITFSNWLNRLVLDVFFK